MRCQPTRTRNSTAHLAGPPARARASRSLGAQRGYIEHIEPLSSHHIAVHCGARLFDLAALSREPWRLLHCSGVVTYSWCTPRRL
eukprot:scaffold60483_cov39-Tisochrysis_lutea.AAC.2